MRSMYVTKTVKNRKQCKHCDKVIYDQHTQDPPFERFLDRAFL